ncbi:MAG: lipopolysaccharide assembly protein LapA domain-containing protein [Synechococcus sp.]
MIQDVTLQQGVNAFTGHNHPPPSDRSGDLLLMRFLQMLVGCLTLLMAAIFAGQNTATVSLRLFRLNSVELPLGLVLIAAVVLGVWSSMIFVSIFSKRRRPVQSAFKAFR